jgi:hypothetical protein
MAVFDVKTFLTLAGQGNGVFNSVGTAFGVPSCLLNLGSEVLKLIPSPALFGILGELENGNSMADGVIKGITSQVRNVFGIIEWDSEEGGFKFVSNSSNMGYETNQAGVLNTIGALVNGVAALGGGLYANYQIADAQIKQIEECIRSYRNYLKFKNGNSANELAKLDPVAFEDYIDEQYQLEMAALRQAIELQNSITDKITEIQDIITERLNDPSLEPVFSCSALPFVSGTGLENNCEKPAETRPEVFRLVYGPPRSTQGQFVLSNDGIYFDSQSSGITPALVYINENNSTLNKADKWKFSQDPNIGGRGDSFSTKDLQIYVNTLLDPSIIDDSFLIKPFYEKDGFLQELISNKNKRIYDLSAQINELETESAPQAVIFNQRQTLISENAMLQEKINKRKKQIELAVKLPQAYATRAKSGKYGYAPGEVPVNDFSYLQGVNLSLDLQKQKALSFSQVEIDGLVSPLQLSTTYVVSRGNTRNSSVEHLIISELGDGAIIYDGSSVSSTNSVILPAESFISTDSLIAMYNFLDTTIESPSSTSFTLRNSVSPTNEKYAQLVGTSQDQIFKVGLGVPFLEGITKHSTTTPSEISGLGSYIKLPNIKEYNDLLYNSNGATIDFWVHMPNLQCISNGYDEGNVSSLFRLVIANENTGYEGTAGAATEAYTNNFGTQVTRGFMMGFTRDVRLTSDQPASYTNPVANSAFFIAPTQSLSLSSVGFINRSSFDGEFCASGNRYHAMIQKVNQPINGIYFSSCENEFCHVAVTFDRSSDTVKFYLDGSLVTTSSMSTVFGISKYSMPNLPTFKKANSFRYTSSALNSTAPDFLKNGPTLDRYFTPWIVGGGYTDGMYQYGNFMGTSNGGIKSGLRGHLGSLKFYSKALTGKEVFENYRAQRGFFKNIDISYLALPSCGD